MPSREPRPMFYRWVHEDPRNRTRVTLLHRPERCEGRASPVREAAERLEGAKSLLTLASVTYRCRERRAPSRSP